MGRLWNLFSFTVLTLLVHSTLEGERQQKGLLIWIKDGSLVLCVGPVGAGGGGGGGGYLVGSMKG